MTCPRKHPLIGIIEIAGVTIDGKTPIVHFSIPSEPANFGWTPAVCSVKVKELSFKSRRKSFSLLGLIVRGLDVLPDVFGPAGKFQGFLVRENSSNSKANTAINNAKEGLVTRPGYTSWIVAASFFAIAL